MYRIILRAYPPSFRRRFGEGMMTVFEMELRRARGHGKVAGVLARAVTDALRTVPREWLDVVLRRGVIVKDTLFRDAWQDVRYAVRGLAARPAMTSALAVTLGFGIGGVTAIESILRGTLYRDLPYAEPEDIHLFTDEGSWSARDLARIEAPPAGLVAVAAYHPTQVVLETSPGRVSAEDAVVVSRDFFQVLGRPLQLGAGFSPEQFQPDGPSSVVIAHSLWRELGGRPDVVGSFVEVDGSPVAVAGVAPAGFYYPDPGTRVYRPMQLDPASEDRFLTVVTRTVPGATETSRASTARFVQGLRGRGDGQGVEPLRLVPARQAVFGRDREPMLLAAGALALVLVMAGVNVGGLWLAHSQRRLREFSIRRAIGASRRRLTRQLLTEAAVLGLLGAAAALALGAAGHGLLLRGLPVSEADASRLAIDLRFVSISLGLGLLVGGAIGLVCSMVVPSERGRGAGGVRATPRSTLLQQALVVAQVALGVALVAGASVLIRSVGELGRLDTGVSPGSAVVIDVVAGTGDYPAGERAALYREVRAAVASLPGTEAVGLTQKLPLRGPGWTTSVRDPLSTGEPIYAPIRFATPGYFESLGVPLLSGRPPSALEDGEGGEPVAWVNQRLAELLWPGSSPTGRVRAWGAERRVAGVVGNVSEFGLTDAHQPTIYVPIGQSPRFLSFTVVARPRPGMDSRYLFRVQERLGDRLPRLAIQQAVPFEEITEAAQGQTLTLMRLLVLLGALALVVGAVGVHGVMSQWVGSRTRGLAISIALGATPAGVLRSVLFRSAALTLTGIGAGLGIYLVGSTALDSVVFGVQRFDPRSLVFTTLVLFVTGLAGALAPAMRAGRSDPSSLMKVS